MTKICVQHMRCVRACASLYTVFINSIYNKPYLFTLCKLCKLACIRTSSLDSRSPVDSHRMKQCTNICRFVYVHIFRSGCLCFLSASRRILAVVHAEYTTLTAPCVRAKIVQCSRRNPKRSSKALLTHTSNSPHKAMTLTVIMGQLGSGTCQASPT